MGNIRDSVVAMPREGNPQCGGWIAALQYENFGSATKPRHAQNG
jgi:hypothetical protein